MLKLIKRKSQAFRKKPGRPFELGPQPYDASFSSRSQAVEDLGSNLTLEQIRARYLARSDQQVPEASSPARSSRLLSVSSTQVESSNVQAQTSSTARTGLSKGKEKAQSDADFDLALALQLQEEEDVEVWSEGFEDIDGLDEDGYEPHPAFPPAFVPTQPRNVVIRSRPTNLPPIPQALFQVTRKPVSASESSTAVPSGNGWEAYDAGKWATARDVCRPQLEYDTVNKECIVCADEKSINRFPQHAVADDCNHTPNTCLDCVEMHIKTELENKLFHDRVVTCTECQAVLAPDDVRRFADPTTFESYASRATDNTIDQIADLFRCPDRKCNSAQIHEDGEESPIVTCIGCQKKYCFNHKIPWHDTLGCDEYDQFLANPKGFKSRLDLENERIERELIEEQERQKREEEASRAYIQELLEGEEREKARRQAEAERAARIERERQEQIQREEAARRAEEARRKLEQEALQRQKEEQANLRTIEKTTKNCPNCSWPIEKNQGCAHMTCSKCNHQFCWECLADHKVILSRDNSAHKPSCMFYPKDEPPQASEATVAAESPPPVDRSYIGWKLPFWN